MNPTLDGVSNRWLQRFWQRVDRTGGDESCWIWRGARSDEGYGRTKFRGREIQAHRAVYMMRVGPIPDGQVVRHKKCDNPPCVNPDHLLIGTREDNNRDAHEKDRHSRGERSGTAKLTDDSVREIVRAFRAGETRYGLAARFGVTHTTICYILQGKKWKHVTAALEKEPEPMPSNEWRAMLRERINGRKDKP